MRVVYGDRKLPAGIVQAVPLELVALEREVVRNPDLERIYTGIDHVFALDDDIERIYRIAAHVEVGRVVLSQIYVVGQQFAFALCLDPQEGSPCGCVVGALLLLGGDSQHFAPAVFRQEERARRLAVLVRCHRRQFGGAQLPGLLILRKQRGDACHIHHLHGLQLQVVIGPVEGDVTDDFGHIAPNGDRNALRFRPDRTGRPAGKRIIDSQLAFAPSCEELSRLVHLSVTKLTRGFSSFYGMPIHQYIIEQRLTQAAQLLLEGDWNVSEIAAIVGYGKPSNFAAAFKKRYGVAPKNYRESYLDDTKK